MSVAGLILFIVAACGPQVATGPQSPDEALSALQEAVAGQDGPTVYALFDRESRGHYRDQVRAWRARVERGEALEQVLPEALEWSREELLEGDAEELTERLLGEHSSFALLGAWFQQCEVIQVEEPSQGEARMVLEGPDGERRAIWFVAQGDGWVYDHYRSRW